MNMRKLAARVAQQYLADRLAYTPETDVEKMIGEITKQQLGITDAPEAFFNAVKGEVLKELGEIDLDNDKLYPTMTRAVIEMAQSMDMIEEK